MAYEQTQKIGGSSLGFGNRVSICGYYSIVSDETVNCYFYKRDINGQWIIETNVTMSGATTAAFGDSLDIGNEYFVIGDPGYNSSSGRAGVYAVSDPSVLIDTLSPSPAAGDSFGGSVVISDQYILVGSPNADLDSGKAYLYIKDDEGAWAPYAGNPITPDIRTSGDYFGCSVAISGEHLIIGAYGNNNKTGAIYIFDKNEDTGLWEESQIILSSDGAYNDQFGESLAASGSYFVAGASLVESIGGDVNVGAAYIYKYGTSWYEVDKLTGESEQDHFGESVDIDGDYIIVGSPNASGHGSADIFYKKRSWGHLKKINGDDSADGDLFGSSVSISGRFSLVGAIENSTNGSVYYAENMVSKLRLAQDFSVNQEYVPSKASIYLKRVGENNYEYWPISNTSKNVIDSTNFSTIDYGDNVVIFGDSVSGFTGNGYMFLDGSGGSTYSVINYPIRALSYDTFNVWIRCLSTLSSVFEADLMMDGAEVKTISSVMNNPSDAEWSWVNTTLVIPDDREHILGIRIKENGAIIDKICIDASSSIPYAEGPDYGESPYFTVHLRVCDSVDNSPGSFLFIHGYKNSINQVVQNDWYNFDINVLDDGHGYISATDFVGDYFLVLSCTGNSYNNFVVWEMVNNDEYVMFPSAFKF